jgi:radical SAM protein with 4Fe4S-binding SPASM domain
VTVEGGGEPLLSPLFSETARLIRKNGLAAGLLTNGLNLFQPEGSHGRRGPKGPGPEILSLFQWIRISLDAYDADSYRRAKGGDGFRKVLANIERLSALCPRPVVGVGYVLCSINDRPEGLLELARKLRQAGADYLAVRPVVDHPELASQMDPGQFRALLGQPLPVSLEALAHNRSEGNLGLPCLAHSLSAVITADGSVYLCGRLYGEAETEPLGNLAQSDFREIWAGQVREEQARALRDGEYCRKRCPQCRMTKYNRLLDGLRRLQTPDFI